MAAVIRILMPLILLCVPYLTSVECRFKGDVTYVYESKMWLTNLQDSRKLNTIAFIGTRDPPTFEISYRKIPRLLPLSDKLTVGIRVFDVGVRRVNNDFAMYNSSFDMQAQFKDLVKGVKTFLQKNPKEFVIMIMHAEYTASNSNLTECEILRTKYFDKQPNLFVQNWTLDDTVGEHRGKILLLQKSPEFSGCSTSLSCIVRDQRDVRSDSARDISLSEETTEYIKYDKGLQDVVRAEKSKCYLFYYTTNRVINYPPEFNGNQKIRYMQYLNEADPPQTVRILEDYFIHTKKSLYITVADLPTVDVINKVIDSN